MKRSNRVLLLLGVGLAVVAFLGVLAVGSMGQAPADPEVETVTVVVAAQDLPLGTQLTPDMLATEERPIVQAADTYSTPAELGGSVVRRSVTAGHVLRTADFDTNASQVDIASSLPADRRAIAISLDQVDGIGYLIQPGDYVDVVLTMSENSNPVAVSNPKYPSESDDPLVLLDDWTNNTSVKVLVQNVQVVAAIDPKAADPSNVVSSPNAPLPTMVAVLAVTPQQAEAVRFAQITGDVSLILRAPGAGSEDVATTGVTLQELVSRWGVLPPAPVAP